MKFNVPIGVTDRPPLPPLVDPIPVGGRLMSQTDLPGSRRPTELAIVAGARDAILPQVGESTGSPSDQPVWLVPHRAGGPHVPYNAHDAYRGSAMKQHRGRGLVRHSKPLIFTLSGLRRRLPSYNALQPPGSKHYAITRAPRTWPSNSPQALVVGCSRSDAAARRLDVAPQSAGRRYGSSQIRASCSG
jgi:hypothetical protein